MEGLRRLPKVSEGLRRPSVGLPKASEGLRKASEGLPKDFRRPGKPSQTLANLDISRDHQTPWKTYPRDVSPPRPSRLPKKIRIPNISRITDNFRIFLERSSKFLGNSEKLCKKISTILAGRILVFFESLEGLR